MDHELAHSQDISLDQQAQIATITDHQSNEILENIKKSSSKKEKKKFQKPRKRIAFDTILPYQDKHCILIKKKDGTSVLGKVIEVVSDGFVLQDLSRYSSPIKYAEVTEIVDKKIILDSPKPLFLEKNLDIFATELIEKIKSSANHQVYTRSIALDHQGKTTTKTKINHKELEQMVYGRLQQRKEYIHICPLCLVDGKYLLCIYENIFCIITKDYKIVSEIGEGSLVDTLFSANDQLITTREEEQRTTFKGILKLFDDI